MSPVAAAQLPLLAVSLACLTPSLGMAEEFQAPASTNPSQPRNAHTASIATELDDALRLLKQHIAEQQRRLSTAQTAHERALIQDFIRMLQEERHTLEELFAQTTGKNADVIESAQEQQSEHRAARSESVLEERAKP